MKSFLIVLVACFGVASAVAQHESHHVAEFTTRQTTSTQQAGEESLDAAAGHVMPQGEPSAALDPHSGHATTGQTAEEALDSHAAHVVPPVEHVAEVDPHAGHAMQEEEAVQDNFVVSPADFPPRGAPPPEAFSGPLHAADTLFDPAVMAISRKDLRSENGGFRSLWVMADQWETRIRDGADEYLWDAQAWYGGDINKLWVKTEGEGSFEGSLEALDLQILWSRAVLPWWDFQAGLRHDFRPGPERSHLVLGLQGLLPYQFEVDAAAFLSDNGDLSARFEAEYDQLITQRLILQPRVEVELAAQDVSELDIGSGVNTAEIGLRLRYEFAREFAPYIGLQYERRFGATADFARAAGEETGGWRFLLGLRMWF